MQRQFSILVTLIVGTLALDIGGVGADGTIGTSEKSAAFNDQRDVQVVVSLLWEGRDLEAHNLEELRYFREEYPNLPLVHLISPAYFTRGKNEQERSSALIRSLVRPQDKVGLLLTSWRSQVMSAGGIYRSGPTLWGHELEEGQCPKDCGIDVPVTLYPPDEVAKLMIHGKVTLENAGLTPVKAFAAQAHLADQKMFNVARSLNMDYDFSPVAPEILANRIQHFPYYQWLEGIWSDIKVGAQPYVISTPDGALITVPLAGGSLDYDAVDTIYLRFDRALQSVKSEPPPATSVFHVQMHQETANRYTSNLSRLVKRMYAGAAEAGIRLTLTAYGEKDALKEKKQTPPKSDESFKEFYPRESLSH